ncbi:hypothetical protein E2C01_051834 [Portunus trituberculatus]|uniref:Uncharacterized protein n=1 Tax=Portunus trituberculatus TaxID=210409 RepID=A0A5B7GKE6_PORTR|nr:hypothetical protein [Portunus trituberculatus]
MPFLISDCGQDSNPCRSSQVKFGKFFLYIGASLMLLLSSYSASSNKFFR